MTIADLLRATTSALSAFDLADVRAVHGAKTATSINVMMMIQLSARGAALMPLLAKQVRAFAAASTTFRDFMQRLCEYFSNAILLRKVIMAELLAFRKRLQVEQGKLKETVTFAHLLAHEYASVKMVHWKQCGSDADVLFRLNPTRTGCKVVRAQFTGCGGGGAGDPVAQHALPGCFIQRDLQPDEVTPAACGVLDDASAIAAHHAGTVREVRAADAAFAKAFESGRASITAHHSKVVADAAAAAAADKLADDYLLHLASEDASDLYLRQ